jgi:hypothetical protein
MAPRLPSDGMVGVNLLFLKGNPTCSLATSAAHRIYPTYNLHAPHALTMLIAIQTLAQNPPHALHG